MDAPRDNKHPQTMQLIAALISAFGVFLVGGTVVLFAWVSEQRIAPVASAPPDEPMAVSPQGEPEIDAANDAGTAELAPSPPTPTPVVRAQLTQRRIARTRSTSDAKKATSPSSRSRTKTPADPDRMPTKATPAAEDGQNAESVYALDLPANRDWEQKQANLPSTDRATSDAAGVSVSSKPPAVGSTTSPAVAPTGRGTVIIMGDAQRVRLTGSPGSFGAGALPAGVFTIQATFDGDETSMAGTVNVGDGERVRIMCIAESQRCSRI